MEAGRKNLSNLAEDRLSGERAYQGMGLVLGTSRATRPARKAGFPARLPVRISQGESEGLSWHA